MEHSLHIACKHFVKTIAPASLKSIHKKVHAALKKAMSAEGNLDLDELDATNFNLDNLEDPNDKDSEDSDDEAGFTPGDALGKALALIKQVFAMHNL